MGELDEDAFRELAEDDLDAALTLLADLTGATDERLRDLARTLAGRVMVDIAKAGSSTRRGIGRLTARRASAAEGDLDLDASLDAIAASRATGSPPTLDDLTVRAWERPDTAVCLLVDRSGSMRGDRLASAAVAAAAVAYRHPDDCSVVMFADTAVVLVAQDERRDADEVVTDLLRLRGHGVTDLGLALRTAAAQLARSPARRRVTILLSDARSTAGADPLDDAATLAGVGELLVLAPAGDTADAEALAAAVGGRAYGLAGPSSVPEVLATALAGA